MKEKLRSYDLTRSGRLRAKQEALHDVRSRTGKAGSQLNKSKGDFRSSSYEENALQCLPLHRKDETERKGESCREVAWENQEQVQRRAAWFFKEVVAQRIVLTRIWNTVFNFKRSELDDLALVKIPKSLSAQEDFFRTLRVLELHEIQDPEMKASIEFVR